MQPQYICPISRFPLVEAPRNLLAELNRAIANPGVQNIAGLFLTTSMENALIEMNSGILYPVRRGVPLLKPSEGISTSGAIKDKQEFTLKRNSHIKLASEFDFWIGCKLSWKTWTAPHFEEVFKEHFLLSPKEIMNRRILDVGCGPLPTLDWAESAEMRVGADPLAYAYTQLDSLKNRTTYVSCEAETLPFADGYFDIVTSFNSLDHVDHFEPVIKELTRVVAPGGLLMILSDIHEQPTINEPLCFKWDLAQRFLNEFDLVREQHFEKALSGVYDSLRAATPFNHADQTQRYGIISLKLKRKVLPQESWNEATIDRFLTPSECSTDEESIRNYLKQVPLFVRQIISESIKSSSGENRATWENLSAVERFRDWRKLVGTALLNNFPQMVRQPELLEEQIAEYYLEFGFIADTLINRGVGRDNNLGAIESIRKNLLS